MKTIALIPARSGSKRLPGKNMALLNGKPLLQYSIEEAKKCDFFNEIVVSSDWRECLDLAEKMGAMPLKRPSELCQDFSHDFEWVSHALDQFPGFDIFTILRPTSPFRIAETIKRAMDLFLFGTWDSLRAIEPTKNHPGKSWIEWDGLLLPYNSTEINGFPGYDLATQDLGPIYCQNGCIHIAWVENLRKFGNVSGKWIKGFLTEGYEGIDINNQTDLDFAGWIMRGKP